jgi:hypothetical protein
MRIGMAVLEACGLSLSGRTNAGSERMRRAEMHLWPLLGHTLARRANRDRYAKLHRPTGTNDAEIVCALREPSIYE